MTPEQFVAATSDAFQSIGARHYFGPRAKAAAESLGIDQFRFYFAGRGGFLGEVDSEVLLSSFGYFNPAVVHKMWTTSIERCNVREAATSQLGVAYELADDHLVGVDGLESAARALGSLTASVDVAALPLFASFRTVPIPAEPARAFMHQVILMRELRGSVHLAAVAATGCPSAVAHQIRRPQDLEMFGYKEAIEVSLHDEHAYAKADPLTDAAMALHVGRVLSSDDCEQISRVTEQTLSALDQ